MADLPSTSSDGGAGDGRAFTFRGHAVQVDSHPDDSSDVEGADRVTRQMHREAKDHGHQQGPDNNGGCDTPEGHAIFTGQIETTRESPAKPQFYVPVYGFFPIGGIIRLIHIEIALDPRLGRSHRLGTGQPRVDGVPICAKDRYGLIIHSFSNINKIHYIPLRTRSGRGLSAVPDTERARFIQMTAPDPEGLSRENHSPHEPILVLPVPLTTMVPKPTSYVDVTDIYTYTPIQGNAICGRISAEDLSRVAALRDSIINNTVPSDTTGISVSPLQQYFRSNDITTPFELPPAFVPSPQRKHTSGQACKDQRRSSLGHLYQKPHNLLTYEDDEISTNNVPSFQFDFSSAKEAASSNRSSGYQARGPSGAPSRHP